MLEHHRRINAVENQQNTLLPLRFISQKLLKICIKKYPSKGLFTMS